MLFMFFFFFIVGVNNCYASETGITDESSEAVLSFGRQLLYLSCTLKLGRPFKFTNSITNYMKGNI